MQGPDVEGFERTVNVHVMRLRKKMAAAAPEGAGYISTVFGVGYRLGEPD